MRKSVFNLQLPPIDNLCVGFIGVGVRGIEAVKRYAALNVRIGAVCDVEPDYLQKAKGILQGRQSPLYFSGEDDWRKVCENSDIELVYISTQWELHTQMATYAMQKGKNVAIEVPLAMSVADCWEIVKTAEQTQRHCIMLENACYDTFELATLNMIKKGLLGEIIHAEGAYIHDLRRLNFQQNDRDTLRGQWRIKYSQHHNGNPYPTHGIAPICQAMNILRGDTLVRLVSMSSVAYGMKHYAEHTFGGQSPQAQQSYQMGDMNSTLIQTQKGKTILLQHDVTSPRPYSRLYVISGSKGFVQKYPTPQMAFDPDPLTPLHQQQIDELLQTHQHEFVTEVQQLCRQLPDQKVMDVIMDYRLVYCLKNGLALDQNVYDGALWSCLVELTEQSVNHGNTPVAIPDFTYGEWRNYNELTFQK